MHTHVEQLLRASKKKYIYKCIQSHSVEFSLVSEHLPAPSLQQLERTPLAGQVLTIIVIYLYKKKSRGNYNKKRPLIK